MYPKIVIFAEDFSEVTAEQIRVADAVVPFTADNQMMLSLINLIRQGERIIPSALLHRMPVEKPEPAKLVTLPLPPTPRQLLSPREREIIRLLTTGDSNKLMARKIGITEATVKVHLKSVQRKIGVINRTQAAMWALANPDEVNDVPMAMATTEENTLLLAAD